ncbi:MAG: sigma-70 family RNA polymerase sigma factor [Prevotella sp.]|jgi:RNA polymerase sigma factor (sigma-70 family)|nr:sigma-70 family RNA polymerase sigma factor [Prevotella sp.]
MFIADRQNIGKDESSLWNDFLSGNDDAYCLIYKTYAERLFIQGMQFSSDKEFIRDCIHDVFVKIYKSRNRLKPVDNVKLYLFIALKNSIISALKKHNMYFEELDEMLERHIVVSDSIEKEYIDKENKANTQRLIRKILALLTTRQREVIHYRFFEGLGIEEIGVLMNMNYQSVQNLIQRSLKKINEYSKKSIFFEEK